MPRCAAACASLLYLTVAAAAAAASSFPLVHVPGLGSVRGIHSIKESDVSLFLGIPFAEPAERFRPPIAKGIWGSAPLDGAKFGNECAQVSVGRKPQMVPESSEDCLFLSIASSSEALAATSNGKLLPVMVWIHGGAYKTGSSRLYQIDSLVARSNRSVVVVSIQYRLAVFGFLGGRAVSARTAGAGSGNFGIMDQRLALTWVRDHIAAFGGDGERVTIFGESAGGNSVLAHLAQPASAGLFIGAIIESGAYTEGATTLAWAESQLEEVHAVTGCPDVACLEAMDAAALLDATSKGHGMAWGPVVDGISLAATPMTLIAQGKHSKVPVLLGSNRDEYSFFMFVMQVDPRMDEPGFDAWLTMTQDFFASAVAVGHPPITPGDVEDIKRIWGHPAVPAGEDSTSTSTSYPYPADLGNFSPWWWMACRFITDAVPGLGHCGVRHLARLLERGGTPAVYTYMFAHPSLSQKQRMLMKFWGMNGTVNVVPHAAEIPYVFGDAHYLGGTEADLASTMAAHWTSFATTGVPSATTEWPRFSRAAGDPTLRFDTPDAGGIRVQRDLRGPACDWSETFNTGGGTHPHQPGKTTTGGGNADGDGGGSNMEEVLGIVGASGGAVVLLGVGFWAYARFRRRLRARGGGDEPSLVSADHLASSSHDVGF